MIMDPPHSWKFHSSHLCASVMLTAASLGPMLSLNQKLDLLQVIGDQFPFGSFIQNLRILLTMRLHAFTFWVDP